MDAEAIAPFVIFLIWAVSGLVRMLSKARQNRTEAHGGMVDTVEETVEPFRQGASTASPKPIPSSTTRRPAASAPPARSPFDERNAAFDERTAAFGDTSLEFAVPPSEGGLGEPLPSGGFAPDQAIPPPSNLDKKHRPAAPQARPYPSAIAPRSTRARVRQLLGSRSGLADAILAAEVLGRPVSERE